MFTGIIETTGTLQRRADHGDDCTLTIASPTFDFSRCALGDSIAVSGVCLTAVALGADHFSADVSHETLRLTTLGALQPGDAVNLEYALTLATPLGGHIAAKGSITVNGVSLTVNAVNANHFSVNIVPHTMSRTTLGALQPGDAVNLEVDLIARYLERLLNASQQSGGLTLETLQKHGY